jgi:hypothetical protein
MQRKNENFKELKLKLKQSPKQSFIEIDQILSNVQDKKAFVFLMDSHETEKEITREILESMLEHIIELNSEYIDVFKRINMGEGDESVITTLFQPKNAKSLIIAAIVIGLVLSVAFNESVAIKIIDIVNPMSKEK